MTSTPTPPPSNIRLTISVTPEVHATFQRMSKAMNVSISKAMGEWLGDTIEAAEFMATKIEQARSAPKLVLAEMHAYALGLSDETGQLIQQIREKGREDREAERVRAGGGPALAGPPPVRAPRSSAAIPPSSNTGGKVPRKPGNPKRAPK